MMDVRRLLPFALLFSPAIACGATRGTLAELEPDGGAAVGFVDPGPVDAGSDAPETVLACVGTECPYPYATCQGTNGAGEVNGYGFKCGVNLLTDNENCGACRNVCPSPPPNSMPGLQVSTQCVQGVCEPSCAQSFQDCNGRVDDGCEIDLRMDNQNCGACKNACPAGPECFNGRCVDSQCVCGCPPIDAGPLPPNMAYGRIGQGPFGYCAVRCSNYYADCNGSIEPDGCEILTSSDPANCGACGKVCAPDQTCIDGQCQCAAGETYCGIERDGNGCANLLADPQNCGICGNACSSRDNRVPICRRGMCTEECAPGFGDCDDQIPGCETNLMINGRHCGACGHQCDLAAGQPCIDGKCLMVECDAGVVTR